MFKVEIHKKDFLISIETNSRSEEPMVRKLIDDITEKFNHKEGIGIDKFDITKKKLASDNS